MIPALAVPTIRFYGKRTTDSLTRTLPSISSQIGRPTRDQSMTKRGTNKMPDENEPVITYSMLTPAAARRRDRRRKMARAGYAIAMTVAVVTPSPLSSVGAAVQAVADASALPITIF